MAQKELSQKEKNWNLMWSSWLSNKLESPLEQLCSYDNEMHRSGHLSFFEAYDSIEKLQRDLDVLYESLPKALSENLKKAYSIYIEYKDTQQKQVKLTPFQIEGIFLEVDEKYYDSEQVIYSNFIDYTIYIERYIIEKESELIQ